MPPRVCLARSLIAWWTVSWWFALNCTSRSPCSHAGSGESFGKAVIGLSFSGLAALIPYRSSNSVDPTDTVTVSPSAGTTGPRMSLSDGGWLTPRLGGVPPLVRNRALVVTVCSRSASAALSAAIESKAATQVDACLPDGPGVSTPDWLVPWNGYDASSAGAPLPCPWPACTAAFASACAPPISTPPASAVPAAPAAVPLRKLRRLTSTGDWLQRLLSAGVGDAVQVSGEPGLQRY